MCGPSGEEVQFPGLNASPAGGSVLSRKVQVRVLSGKPIWSFSTSRYLIDFITDISDVSSGLSPLESDPGVDSNSLSDQHPPNESTLAHYACQLPDGRRSGHRTAHCAKHTTASAGPNPRSRHPDPRVSRVSPRLQDQRILDRWRNRAGPPRSEESRQPRLSGEP